MTTRKNAERYYDISLFFCYQEKKKKSLKTRATIITIRNIIFLNHYVGYVFFFLKIIIIVVISTVAAARENNTVVRIRTRYTTRRASTAG